MLGVLLLGAEILLVSAAWRQSYVKRPDVCVQLLNNWTDVTAPSFISLYWTVDGYLCFNKEYESGGYNFSVTFDLGVISRSNDYELYYNFPCFGVSEVRIRSTTRDGEEGRAEVILETSTEKLVGGMIGMFQYCSRENCIFIPAPGLMDTATLKYSPLMENFWTNINDSNIFDKAWIIQMSIHTIVGNIPSQWVSRLTSSSLESLSITGNNWRRPKKLLGCLPALTFLYLTDNNIEVLPNDTFICTPSLLQVHLSGNRLLQLPFGLKSDKYVLEFHLENQKGRSVFQISDQDSPFLQNLRLIALRNVTVRIGLCNISNVVYMRRIEVINTKILSVWEEEIYCTGSILSITSLALRRSNLSILPRNLIKRMTNIEDLDVHGNHLTDCQGHVLGILRTLRSLDMSNNRLRKLTANCFQTIKSLTVLKLSENEIVSIAEDTFVSLINLSVLDLSRNKLVSIERGTFVSLVELSHLNLSRNTLVSIERGTFSGLKNLKHLDVSFNKLINIHYSIFLPVGTEELFQPLLFTDVDLSNNELSEVILWTQSMITITFFDLSNNSIRKIEVGNVESLNLSYNNLDHIPDGLVTIPENLTVDFGGNIIACCHPNNFMLAKSTMTIYNLGTSEPLYCVQNNDKIMLQSVLLNTSLCVIQESGSTVSVELWVSLGVFTAVAAVFMSFVYYYRTELAYLSLFAKILKRGMRTDEQKYNDAAYDAFVCYCGKNLAWILRHLLQSIEGTDEGYRLCIHDRDFTLGAAIDTNVLTALDKSRKVIFVLSPDFMSSKWCRWELEMATHKMFEEERHYIILIELESLEGVVLAKQLKHLMKTRTYLHWPGDSATEDYTAKFWGRLRRALGQSLLCKTGRKLPQMTVLDIEE